MAMTFSYSCDEACVFFTVILITYAGQVLVHATSSFASDIVKSAVAEIKTTYQELEKGIVEKTQSVADFVLPYVYLFSYETAYFRYPL